MDNTTETCTRCQGSGKEPNITTTKNFMQGTPGPPGQENVCSNCKGKGKVPIKGLPVNGYEPEVHV